MYFNQKYDLLFSRGSSLLNTCHLICFYVISYESKKKITHNFYFLNIFTVFIMPTSFNRLKTFMNN